MIDTLIALRILWILVTPIEETQAFKLGLLDKDGKTVRKAKTADEKAATSALHRLIWNLKRMISLVPGGSTRIGSLAAAYLLMKESQQEGWTAAELEQHTTERFEPLCESALVQEDANAELDKLFDMLLSLSEDAPVNATGAAVSTDVPTKRLLDKRAVIRRKFTKTLA
jgi:hypothetical protein